MLKVKDLEASYGEVPVLWGINIEVQEGEAVAVIGSNGAGKTTLLNSVVGLLRPIKGQVTFEGTNISELPAHKIARIGISYVPAERELFPQLSVLENLDLGAYFIPKERDTQFKYVFELFPVLQERKKQLAGTLSGGQQQMLAIGRGLMSNPKMLLLDEPSTGLAPQLISKLYQSIQQLKQKGLTVLVAEQQVPMALKFTDRAYVVENGLIKLSGSSIELIEDPQVKSAYLGVI